MIQWSQGSASTECAGNTNGTILVSVPVSVRSGWIRGLPSLRSGRASRCAWGISPILRLSALSILAHTLLIRSRDVTAMQHREDAALGAETKRVLFD